MFRAGLGWLFGQHLNDRMIFSRAGSLKPLVHKGSRSANDGKRFHQGFQADQLMRLPSWLFLSLSPSQSV